MLKSLSFSNWQGTTLQRFICYSIVLLSLLLILCTGCTSFRLPGQSAEVNLDLQVSPGNFAGVYNISGSADLPNQTKIAVAAVRYLYPTQSINQAITDRPTYSVLDYQEAEIKDKQWQTRLNLWQVAKDGRYAEAWQLEQPKTGLTVAPAPEIIFLATLTPGKNLARVEQQLAQRSLRFSSAITRSTSDGDWYVQVSQSMTAGLPNDKTAPLLQSNKENNDGWGDRYVLVPEPPNPIQLEQPSNRRTNAPYSAAEFLR
ncbi:MAG TPA: hypothetical protein V6D10_02225 [Trichocoleus sp.]|jgi:hypothetical protein